MTTDVVLFFQWCVIQQFFDQVHMSQEHSSATISFQAKCVESITFRVFGLQQTQVCFPFVADDFAAGEAADWNNHLCVLFTLPTIFFVLNDEQQLEYL